MVSAIKSLVPPFLEPALIALWFLLRPVVKVVFFGRQRYCPICSSHCRLFLSHGSKRRRPNIVCPVCLGHDRHRLAYLFLTLSTNLMDGKPKRMLHLAPEPELRRQFKSAPGIQYVSGDWASPHAAEKFDITNMPLPDAAFDVIYCSHVLEHVVDDRRAIGEIYRVLTPGGWALIQVPIAQQQNTVEFTERYAANAEISWYAGHVRQYGSDFVPRLTDAGFEVQVVSASQITKPEECERMSLSTREPLFFCQRTGSVVK